MSGSIIIRQPPTLPGDVPWEPPHNYECSRGHEVRAEKPLDRCPVHRRGERCDGTLTAFGRGSRS